MTWDWSSPIALGVFLLMLGGTVLLLGLALAVMSGGVKTMATLPAPGQNGRRGRR